MFQSLSALILAAGAVTLAEMGDKTQLLAMAFATRFSAKKVMIGVFLATVLNHACAVALGTVVSKVDGLSVWIQGIAALSFIFFGLWTIRGDKLEGEENRQSRFGAVMTVAIAFFIAELGDKTQLTTIALAVRFPDNPVAILMGSTTGMMIADGLGILIGVLMCRRIPARTVKLVSAGIFILFGFVGTAQMMFGEMHMDVVPGMLLLVALALVTGAFSVVLMRRSKHDDFSQIEAYCRVRNVPMETEEQTK